MPNKSREWTSGPCNGVVYIATKPQRFRFRLIWGYRIIGNPDPYTVYAVEWQHVPDAVRHDAQRHFRIE